MLRLCGILTAVTLCATSAFAQTVETEPNNSPATANTAVLGGKVRGTLRYIDGSGNGNDDSADWWVLNVTAGQTIFADVDANEFGSGLDAGLWLYAADGVTLLTSNGNWDGLDPQLTYYAPTSGLYYLKIGTGPGPYTAQPYTINFFEVKCPVSNEEKEPNDAAGNAVNVALGQTIHGFSCPYGDRDFFRIHVSAGTKFEVQVDTVGRERPAFGCACGITAGITLYGPDGETVLARTSENDYPKRIQYQPTTNTSAYYIAVGIWPGGIRYPYTLHVRSLSRGRGDPPTARADGLGMAWAVIADQNGDFIVADREGNRVWWVATDGRKQVIIREVSQPSGLGWDVFGNLLITNRHAVYKLTPQGNVSTMIVEEGIDDVALAPDGTLWFGDPLPGSLRHYDALGNPIESINPGLPTNEVPSQVAVAASGEVFFTSHVSSGGSVVYRLVSGRGQRVFGVPWEASDLAMDQSGNFYLTSGFDNHVYRYSSNGIVLDDPFASELSLPLGIAFGRNADGSMTNRLFVTEQGGRFVELNGNAPERGAPVGFATSAQAIADLLKSGSVLSDTQRRALDAVGNKNGRYDVGDLRAFLILTMKLSPGAPFGAGGKP